MLSFFESNYIFKKTLPIGQVIITYDYYTKYYYVYLNRKFVFTTNYDSMNIVVEIFLVQY